MIVARKLIPRFENNTTGSAASSEVVGLLVVDPKAKNDRTVSVMLDINEFISKHEARLIQIVNYNVYGLQIGVFDVPDNMAHTLSQKVTIVKVEDLQ